MIPFARVSLTAALILTLAATGAEAARRHKPVPKPRGGESETIVVTGYRAELIESATVRAVWTQYGPGGVLEARAVMAGKACPMLALDLKQTLMMIRSAATTNFSTLCSAVMPSGTKQAALAFRRMDFKSPPPNWADSAAMAKWVEEEYGVPLPTYPADWVTEREWQQRIDARTKYDLVPLLVPVADPQRILVLGDTGCRIKGTALQDCSNPEEWPFARVAAEAAKLKPDLVIHVGDYLYREQACPADFKGCTGTPFGDNWPTWDADFFAPAKPLLAAAPWVIVRGNHEDCSRAGPGFIRLLGPSAFDPKAACSDHLPPYAVPFAALNLVVTDNADAPEQSVVEASVPVYRAEIASLANEKAPTWWLLHRPIWGAIAGPLGIPIGGNLTMMAAVSPAGIPAPVALMLSGHIHTFETFNYDPDNHVPPQLVAGHGGDSLDVTPTNLGGTIFQGASGVHVKDGLSIGGFGFVLMTRGDDGWRLDVYDAHGRIERVCQFHNAQPGQGRLDCPRAKR